MHGNANVEKVILEHRVCKVRNNRVRKEKGLLKRETLSHIGHDVREARGT